MRPDTRGFPTHEEWESLRSFWRGSEKRLTEIKLKKGESVDKALRRLKKKIDRKNRELLENAFTESQQ